MRLKRVFEEATQANLKESYRNGDLIELPPEGDLMVFGDLHGNEKNFEEILTLVELADNTKRHVILQEATHNYAVGEDKSFLLHEKLATFKINYPDRVHIIIGNHELSEVTGREILKGGICYNIIFREAMKRYYDRYYEEVKSLLHAFMKSMPAACRTPNRFFISHSIPKEAYVKDYSLDLFRKDGEKRSGEYLPFLEKLVWGRDLSKQTAAAFAKQVESDFLVVGHTACKCGFQLPNDRQIVLDCKDAMASYLHINLEQSYQYDDIKKGCIKRLYSKLIKEFWAIKVKSNA